MQDVAIIGGGIVGLATAYQVTQQFPDWQVTVIEKEASVAQHQTGHNSGVLHSGIYYRPGSLKATNCRTGKAAMERFCQEHQIPYDICGKVIVAVDDSELQALERIYERGQANGVTCRKISVEELAELEPHAAGVAALHVPETGIVDFVQVCRRLAQLLEAVGGQVLTQTTVRRIERRSDGMLLHTSGPTIESRYVINCAGLQSDRVTRMSGQEPTATIIPFRGEYYRLKKEAEHLCRTLIYPVPNPEFPFLGVHFTRMINGGVECGPNAVLALAREGYRWRDFSPYDLWETFRCRGFYRLAGKYWRVGMGEMYRSLSKTAFVKALQRLVPEIAADQLERIPAGVRAQAVSPAGQLVDDFLIDRGERVINVGNAPSPAATSALNIAANITQQLHELQ
jgi:L-2-hydroxyglutarate oxidase